MNSPNIFSIGPVSGVKHWKGTKYLPNEIKDKNYRRKTKMPTTSDSWRHPERPREASTHSGPCQGMRRNWPAWRKDSAKHRKFIKATGHTQEVRVGDLEEWRAPMGLGGRSLLSEGKGGPLLLKLVASGNHTGLSSPAISFWSSQWEEIGEEGAGKQVVCKGPVCDVSDKMEKGRAGAWDFCSLF